MELQTRNGKIGVDDRHADKRHALVLLHAFPFDKRVFDAFIDASAASHTRLRTIAIDARGFGETPLVSDGNYQLTDLADDVVAVLDALGIEHANILGNSMGGYVALALARTHQRRIDKLILVGTRATADSDNALIARATSIDTLTSGNVTSYLDGLAERMMSRRNTHLDATVAELASRNGRAMIAGLRALRDRPNREAELRGVERPVLVVGGNDDSIVTSDEIKQLASGFANAQLAMFADCGHLIPLERPAELVKLVDEFIAP